MKKEDLKKAYGKSSDRFHHSVMNTLYHLDDKTTAPKKQSKRISRVIIACAIIAAVGTTTAAAAAGLFGLFSKPVGKYGVNIATEYSDNVQNTAVTSYQAKIVPNYLPDGFEGWSSNGSANYHLNGNIYSDSWYFTANTFEADSYNQTEMFVIENTETEFNGHKTVISKQKASSNSDHIRYVVTEFFEDNNIVVRCVFSGDKSDGKYFEPDYSEIILIMENLTIEITEVTLPNTYYSDFSDKAISEYNTADLLDNGKYEVCNIGDIYTAAVSNYDDSESKLSIKVVSVTEQKNAYGFEKEDFLNAGEGRSLYDRYFDANGELITEYTVTETDEAGDGIDSLAKTHEKTYHRHFYNIHVELTSDCDIEDIYSVLGFDAIGFTESRSYYKMSSSGFIEKIGHTNWEHRKLEKNKTLVLNCAVVADEETGNDAHFVIKTANASLHDGTLLLFNIRG